MRFMKLFFDLGNRYAENSTWKDFALVKFCLCAMGIMIGLCVPQQIKTVVFAVAAVIFVVTYIPLMVKMFRLMKSDKKKKQ